MSEATIERAGAPAAWWQPAGEASRPLEGAPDAIAYRGLLAFTFVLILSPQSFFPALAPLRIALVFALIAILSHLYGCFLDGRPYTRLTLEMGLAAALCAWSLSMVPLSYWPGGSLSILTDLYFKAMAVFWLMGNVVTTRGRLRGTCWAMTLMMIPLALTAIHNFLTGDFMPGARIERIEGYAAPLTQNPNDLALLLNLVLPICWALMTTTPSAWTRTALLAILGLHALGVVLTFSRAGFLTLASSAALCSGKMIRRGQWGGVVVALILIALAVPLMPSGYGDRISTITDVDSDPTGSAQARWSDTLVALDFVQDHPLLGAGPGMNVLALNEVRGPKWKEVHNAYLEYAVDLGLPGLGLFVLLLGTCLYDTRCVRRRCAQSRDGGELAGLADGIQVSLVAFALAALFHPVAYQFYFFYVAGLAVAAKAVCDAEVAA